MRSIQPLPAPMIWRAFWMSYLGAPGFGQA